MLPKIDAFGGRGAPRGDALQNRAVVALPRLRLLKQVSPEETPQHWPPPAAAHLGGGSALPIPPGRRLLRSRGDSNERRPGDGNNNRRGRGLLRPLDLGDEAHHEPRSPPVLPWANRGGELQVEHEADSAAALLQQRARERVKEQRRQRRREAREEEERRQQEEQDRLERVQRQSSQVEAHRHNLAKQAAERARRVREDKEDKVHEREELQSARRERMRRYQTPAKIREITDSEPHHHCRSSASGGSGSEAPAGNVDGGHVAAEDVCSCGNVFMPDSAFCRKCGEKRLGELKEARDSPERRGNPRRAGRAANAEVHGSRDRDRRRRHGGRSRGGARDRRTSRGHPTEHPDCPADASTGNGAAGEKSVDKTVDVGARTPAEERSDNPGAVDKAGAQKSYYHTHVLQGLDAATWALLHAPFESLQRRTAQAPLLPAAASTEEQDGMNSARETSTLLPTLAAELSAETPKASVDAASVAIEGAAGIEGAPAIHVAGEASVEAPDAGKAVVAPDDAAERESAEAPAERAEAPAETEVPDRAAEAPAEAAAMADDEV